MVELPLRHPELFQRLGIEPPKGVLPPRRRVRQDPAGQRQVANESERRLSAVRCESLEQLWIRSGSSTISRILLDLAVKPTDILVGDQLVFPPDSSSVALRLAHP